MTEGCAFSQEKGTRRVCGLLGTMELSSGAGDGQVVALREIVEHFQIEWEIAVRNGGNFEKERESGFVFEIRGRHKPGDHSTVQPCSHCANLMLALRIIEEWLLPRGGSCPFCTAEASSTFVHGDRHGQREASSTRTLCVSSGPGTPCQLVQCHEFCMNEIRERLAMLGAAERTTKGEAARRAKP